MVIEGMISFLEALMNVKSVATGDSLYYHATFLLFCGDPEFGSIHSPYIFTFRSLPFWGG